MAERSKAHAWRACKGETPSWVRIPLLPPVYFLGFLDERRGAMERNFLLVVGVFLTGCLFLIYAAPIGAASIVGSYHDLAHIDDVHIGPTGWGRTYDDYNQVCVYCHTPHHASDTQKPLWNRPDTTAVFTVYTSPTMSSTPDQPAGITRMCLSCHDGTIAVDKLLNLPNTGVESVGVHGTMIYPRQQVLIDCASCHQQAFADWFPDFTPSYLGTNLSDDHPVAVVYPTNKKGMVPPPPDGRFPNGVRLVNGRVECTSCHDPHDPGIKPFLRTSNAGSALCYTCHAK